MSKYNLIIFDLDDTLFDYKATELQALKKACSTLNIEFNKEIYNIYKKANKKAKETVPNYLLKIDDFRNKRTEIFFDLLNRTDCSCDIFINEYLKSSENGVLIEGVQETLETLNSIQKVVATNGSNYPRHNKLKNSKISKYFTDFFSAETLGVSKPNPVFFLKICDAMSMNPNEVLVVGDSIEMDIFAASNAGIDSCLVIPSSENLAIPPNAKSVTSIRGILGVLL